MKHVNLIKHHHLKATPQRIAIIELMDSRGHVSIDDLYQSIRQKFISISLATLYKNIHTMMDVSLIREVKIPEQKTKYEIEKESHAHVICKTCGEIKDITLNPLSVLENAVLEHTVEDITIVISGTCPKCQKKEKK
jgi:Fur family peroxide stress response transcriptional regulator